MNEIFTIKATRCTRCGGILLSDFGLKHGMGHVCKKKHDEEHAPPDPDQITFFDGESKITPLGELGLSVHAFCSLSRAGYSNLEELAELSNDELWEAVGSNKDYRIIKNLLEE